MVEGKKEEEVGLNQKQKSQPVKDAVIFSTLNDDDDVDLRRWIHRHDLDDINLLQLYDFLKRFDTQSNFQQEVILPPFYNKNFHYLELPEEQ